ncbi:hypothetical protein QUC31_013515 [Theobroma cacao]|uniref:Sphingoid base hydroxylase 2 n=1 Tax=Theobroma cacao TaxID=3641 RepID=A0A061EAI1_THECC|nr:Sphingoid base hydroxylase 2 [Theobroma cacao]
MAFPISDEVLGTFVPIAVYWIYSGICMALGSFENYRLHTKKDEEEKNLVTKQTVINNVLLLQTLQATVAVFLFKVTGNDAGASSKSQSSTSLVVSAGQFVMAMLVLDTWHYFMHRYFHRNKFLYRYIHSQHHRLVVPYAFGAFYNHPLEAFVLDIMGSGLSYLLSGMSPRTSIFFFCFTTIKSVDDHCGLWLPAGNLFHIFFSNNSAYHDVHHHFHGGKYNFSQPFFSLWDRIMGTYLPYTIEERAQGGFQVRPAYKLKEHTGINDELVN